MYFQHSQTSWKSKNDILSSKVSHCLQRTQQWPHTKLYLLGRRTQKVKLTLSATASPSHDRTSLLASSGHTQTTTPQKQLLEELMNQQKAQENQQSEQHPLLLFSRYFSLARLKLRECQYLEMKHTKKSIKTASYNYSQLDLDRLQNVLWIGFWDKRQ